jgi:protoporphyrinogen oxidase
MLEPAPLAEILHMASTLAYRHVILAAFTIHKEYLGRNASTYFPDEGFPFVRIYEPKQRSPLMAPKDKTSLVAEITCDENDPLWTLPDDQLRSLVESHLLKCGWFTEQQIGKMISHRMPYAYPVQDLDVAAKVQKLHEYCGRFENLHISGRNGRFSYIHIHHLMALAKEIVSSHSMKNT